MYPPRERESRKENRYRQSNAKYFDNDGVQPASAAQSVLLAFIRARRWRLRLTWVGVGDIYQAVVEYCLENGVDLDSWRPWYVTNANRKVFREARKQRTAGALYAYRAGYREVHCEQCSEQLEWREVRLKVVALTVRHVRRHYPRLLRVDFLNRRRGVPLEEAIVATGYGRTAYFKDKRNALEFAATQLERLTA